MDCEKLREKERQLLFQCHSWPPSGVFRPLKSPPCFRRPQHSYHPLLIPPSSPPSLPRLSLLIPPSSPSSLSRLSLLIPPSSLNPNPAPFALLHCFTFTLLSVFLPSFFSSFDFPPLFPFPIVSEPHFLFSSSLLLPSFLPTQNLLFIS